MRNKKAKQQRKAEKKEKINRLREYLSKRPDEKCENDACDGLVFANGVRYRTVEAGFLGQQGERAMFYPVFYCPKCGTIQKKVIPGG